MSLTQEHSAFIAGCVDSGRYKSASEVVRDALRLLQDAEQKRAAEIERIRGMVQAGLAQADRGETVAAETFFKNWEASDRRARKRRTGR